MNIRKLILSREWKAWTKLVRYMSVTANTKLILAAGHSIEIMHAIGRYLDAVSMRRDLRIGQPFLPFWHGPRNHDNRCVTYWIVEEQKCRMYGKVNTALIVIRWNHDLTVGLTSECRAYLVFSIVESLKHNFAMCPTWIIYSLYRLIFYWNLFFQMSNQYP